MSTRLAVAGIVLMAFALRAFHLDAMSFWSDEGISVLRARLDLPALLANLPVEHVPLYFASLHGWMALAGEGDFAVRYFSLWFGVLSVPLVYRLARAGLPGAKRWAGAAALLAAINPLQVWYAQEARMYSLLVALAAGAGWCLLRASAPGSRNRHWLAFALLTTAALYTHFFAALTLAGFAVWCALAVWRGGLEWRRPTAAFALIGILAAPWLARAFGALSFPGWQAAADPSSLPQRYLVAYTLGNSVAAEWQWLAVGFLVLLVLGTVRSVSLGVRGWLALCGALVPFALMMALAVRKPGYHERYLIVVTPFLFVVLAAALDALPRRIAAATLAVLAGIGALGLNGLYFDPTYAKPDFRAAAQYVDRLSRDGDGLIFDGPDPQKAFYRYFSRQRVAAFDETEFDTRDPGESGAFLTREVPRRERWWVVLYFNPPGPTEDWLAARGYQTSSRWFNGIRVLLYATPTEASLGSAAIAQLQTQLPLALEARTFPRARAGDVLPLVVRWQVRGALPADYQASVRLLDASGNVVRQVDRRPLDGRVPTSQWKAGDVIEDRYGLLIPESAAPGEYTPVIILYSLGGGDALRATLAPLTVLP